ncbi:MAG: hypothetical protein WCK86_23695 [Planctomycetia bacterium]
MKLRFSVIKMGFSVIKMGFSVIKMGFTVIPAQAGIQIAALNSRLRGNDASQKLRFDKALGEHANSTKCCLTKSLNC